MCLQPHIIRTKDGINVGKCGHCLECMKDRQNDIAHRLWLASKRNPNIHFFTLTYSNEKCPLYVKATDNFLYENGYMVDYEIPFTPPSVSRCDIATRVVAPDEYPKTYVHTVSEDLSASYLTSDNTVGKFPLDGFYLENSDLSPFFCDETRSNYWSSTDRRRKNDCVPMRLNCLGFDNDAYYGDFTVTPSLKNSDVTDWIKSFRKGDRKNSFKFKYYFCGEYGPQTSRPHYHLIAYGLTDSQANMMLDRWIDRFGGRGSRWCSTVSRVRSIDFDGKDHAAAAARYVGKYISKGTFESKNVTEGRAVKPRSVSSKGMYEITKVQFEWYSGKDLLIEEEIKYRVSSEFQSLPEDVKKFYEDNGLYRFLPNSCYTEDTLSLIDKRQFYTLPNQTNQYRIGKTIKNKVLKCYYNDKIYEKGEFKIKKRLRSTPLSRALSDYVRLRITSGLLEQYRQIRKDTPRISDSQAVKQIKESQRLALSDRQQNANKNYKNFLRKTHF